MMQDFGDIHRGLVVLIDPDKSQHVARLLDLTANSKVDCFFVGGSGELKESIDDLISLVHSKSKLPCYIFPGSETQITDKASGILILSLLSGRNPEYLIGKLVKASLKIKKSGLKTIPVGYILVDGGTVTSTQQVTQTLPIHALDIEQIVKTAIAGELLGMKAIYLEAGSGAKNTISTEIIQAVKKEIKLPLIVGGGIRDAQTATDLWNAGANMIVVGNVLEKTPSFIQDLSQRK